MSLPLDGTAGVVVRVLIVVLFTVLPTWLLGQVLNARRMWLSDAERESDPWLEAMSGEWLMRDWGTDND